MEEEEKKPLLCKTFFIVTQYLHFNLVKLLINVFFKYMFSVFNFIKHYLNLETLCEVNNVFGPKLMKHNAGSHHRLP